VTKKIIFNGISRPFAWFDRNVVDATMNLIGNSTVNTSKSIKGLQSGKFQDYAFSFVMGAVVIAIVFIYLWTN
jgi:NADH-quinone oxidoreductase subunit L